MGFKGSGKERYDIVTMDGNPLQQQVGPSSSSVNQEEIWRAFEQKEQTDGTKDNPNSSNFRKKVELRDLLKTKIDSKLKLKLYK